MPPRLLALDLGSKRTGLAISDELGYFAHPRPALKGNHQTLLNTLPTLIHQEGITEVVVGLPLSLSGEDSPQTTKTRSFINQLRQRLDIPVTTQDERLSTAEASRYVPSNHHRDGQLDSAAAAILLQSVLDSRSSSHTATPPSEPS